MSKLREQMDNAMIVRGYSKGTRRHYISCVNQLSKYLVDRYFLTARLVPAATRQRFCRACGLN